MSGDAGPYRTSRLLPGGDRGTGGYRRAAGGTGLSRAAGGHRIGRAGTDVLPAAVPVVWAGRHVRLRLLPLAHGLSATPNPSSLRGFGLPAPRPAASRQHPNQAATGGRNRVTLTACACVRNRHPDRVSAHGLSIWQERAAPAGVPRPQSGNRRDALTWRGRRVTKWRWSGVASPGSSQSVASSIRRRHRAWSSSLRSARQQCRPRFSPEAAARW